MISCADFHTLLDERETHVHGGNVLPVEGETHEAQALVTVRAPKEVRDYVLGADGNMLRREAEDVDTVQEREDVGREDLPDEHARERAPEELQTLVVRGAVEVKSYGEQG